MHLCPNTARRRFLAVPGLALALILHPTFGGAETLEVNDAVYLNVVVRSKSPSHLTISHDGGISQIALADLPAEWQEKLGYDPATAARHQAKVEAQTRARTSQVSKPPKAESAPPEGYTALRPAVDMRTGQPSSITRAKDQGNRPVNDIYALVTAIEYICALKFQPTPLSEEFVLWAVRQTYPELDFGTGVHFPEIIKAIQIHGICREELFTNKIAQPVTEVADPSLLARNDASSRRNLQAIPIQAKGKAALAQILFNLNEDRPVVIVLRWPHRNTFRQNATLRAQVPLEGSMHVVTLIGYRPDPQNQDAVLLLFRNSFGPTWGTGGYGSVALDYLNSYFLAGFAVDLY